MSEKFLDKFFVAVGQRRKIFNEFSVAQWVMGEKLLDKFFVAQWVKDEKFLDKFFVTQWVTGKKVLDKFLSHGEIIQNCVNLIIKLLNT